MENIYFEEDSKRLTKEVWSHLNKGHYRSKATVTLSMLIYDIRLSTDFQTLLRKLRDKPFKNHSKIFLSPVKCRFL